MAQTFSYPASSALVELHNLLKTTEYKKAVKLINSIKKELKITNFNKHKNYYVRHIVLNTDNYWLLVLRWDGQVLTPIHGHPKTSFIYILSGEFSINNYRDDGTTLIDTVSAKTGDYYHYEGSTDSLDNAIHSIETHTEGLSLHFYSDDPRKGTVFN